MLQSLIHRAALGRSAKIGALYDIRTEGFMGDTLFGSKLEDEAIEATKIYNTAIELVMTDNLREKFKKLDIEAELQVSLLSGLVKLNGSGTYLSEEKNSARAQSMSLLYKYRTVKEDIMIRRNKDKIDMNILSPSSGQGVEATHVVVGIDWGAVCSVTCEYENKEDEDVIEVKGALSAELDKLKGLIDPKGSVKAVYDDKSKESHRRFTFKCKADVSVPDKNLPVTFEGAVELARSLPSLVEKINNGKGVPLTFTLMPLEAIIKMCRFQVKLQIQYHSIDEDIITKCGQVMEWITKTRQTLYDIRNDLYANADYVCEGSLVGIGDICEKFDVKESGFKAGLQDLVKRVRSGYEDASLISSFVSREMSDTFSLSRYDKKMRKFQQDFNKVKSIKSWKGRGIIYIGRKDDVIVDDKRIVYVFYKTSNGDYKNILEKNQDFFLRLQKTHAKDHENHKFVVVDQEIRNDLWPTDTKVATIHKFVNGSRISKDSYAKEGNDTEMCLIKSDAPAYYQMLPSNRTNVKLKCPNSSFGNGECSGNLVTWMCSKCKHVVEYGIKTKLFYCKCGQSDPRKSLFRCNEKDHGIDFVNYPDGILATELSKLRAMKEKNILILGETGVGKSTWINGFINYLYFSDIEEAINSEEFQVLIPSSFTFTTQKGQQRKIVIGGTDANETMEVGISATQEPRSYVFSVGEQRIRLIDTPGVGDSRGIEQDEENFDNILSYLTYYDEIHAVCILLKPNNSRLTAMFRFCIQELLAHLHTSAKNNIVFCFTNARGTFYKPGDTLPSLNRELQNKNVGIVATPHNYFCFDNEPFRFLACIHNGVEFSKEDIDTYAKSWDKSVLETKRLFEYIDKLSPHKVKNTVNMNEARRIILAMSKPLAEVAKAIQENVQLGQRYKHEIDNDDKALGDLRSKLKRPGFSLKRKELNYPRTVCTDSSCTTIEDVIVGDTIVTRNVIYKQVCHSPCGLRGIPTETTNDFRLKGCWCIQGTQCRHSKCGHSFKQHMHITYEIEKVPEEFFSKTVQEEINKNTNLKDQKEIAKREIDTKIEEMKKEQDIVMKTSAKYGSFLKANAIIPYNDAVGDYLDMSIKQERDKAALIRNDTLVATMESMKSQYMHQRQILDSAIVTNSGENINTPDEVMKLQKELFGLKHMGETLKELFEGISIARSANNIAFEEKIAPVRQNYTRRDKNNDSSFLGSLVKWFSSKL